MGSLPETFNDSTSFHLIVRWSLLPRSPQLSKCVQTMDRDDHIENIRCNEVSGGNRLERWKSCFH